MKKVLLIYGEITFLEDKAIVHRIDKAFKVDADKVDAIGELALETHETLAYIAPSLYGKEVEYADSARPTNDIVIKEGKMLDVFPNGEKDTVETVYYLSLYKNTLYWVWVNENGYAIEGKKEAKIYNPTDFTD